MIIGNRFVQFKNIRGSQIGFVYPLGSHSDDEAFEFSLAVNTPKEFEILLNVIERLKS